MHTLREISSRGVIEAVIRPMLESASLWVATPVTVPVPRGTDAQEVGMENPAEERPGTQRMNE